MDEYQSLMTRHQALQAQSSRNPQAVNLDVVRKLVTDLREAGRVIDDTEQRDRLNEVLQYWADFLHERTGERVDNLLATYGYHLGDAPPPAPPRKSLWLLVIGGTVGIILVAVVVAYSLLRNLSAAFDPTDVALITETPTVLETPAELPVMPSPELVTTETPPLLPSPTPELPAATPVPTETEELAEAAPIPQDPAGDVTSLATGQAVADPPAGVDLASCNITAGTVVQPGLAPPLELPAGEGQLTLWLTLHEPVPADRTLNYHFLVALDMDATPGTGRPVGAGFINPELGTEVGAGVFLYPDGSLDPYLFIWDPAQGDWTDDARVPAEPEVTLNAERSAIALTFDLEALRAAVQAITNVTPALEEMRGRVGVIASSATQAAIADFCPDLP